MTGSTERVASIVVVFGVAKTGVVGGIVGSMLGSLTLGAVIGRG